MDGGLGITISTILSNPPLPIGRQQAYTLITNLATEVFLGKPNFSD